MATSEMNDVRKILADGGNPWVVDKCFDPERNGVRSFRQKTLGMINRGVPLKIQNTCIGFTIR